jgi:acid phosphatase type 7
VARNGVDLRVWAVLAIVAVAFVAGAVLLLGGRSPSSAGPGTSGPTAGSAGPRATSTTAGSERPRATADAVLVGAGDIADCGSDGDEATAKLLDGLDGTVFTLGDNAYELGTSSEFRRCYDPSWGRQLDRTRPVAGNHDYLTKNAAGYFGYYGAAAGDPMTGWYAYDIGAWRVYVLNSNCALVGGCKVGSAQEQWLRGDLAANPRECVLAMWHHPRFSSGMHGNDAITGDLWTDLYDAGAELVLNGHDHDYERFGPQTPGGRADPARGIVEMVVGTGGRSHYAFETIRANSLVRDDTTYGVLRLVLSSGGWSFEFLPVPGGTFTDSGSAACH